IDMPVEPAGPEQCRVEHVTAISGCEHDHAAVAAKAVHLREQLVEGAFPLVIGTGIERVLTARPAHGIDLVDKDDRRRLLLSLAKKVPDPRRADAYEHLYEFTPREREKGNIGFAGHRF